MILGTFFAMLVGHALADYPLQGEFVASGKNRYAPIPGVPWYQILGAHSLIHGGFVGLIAWMACGAWWLGILEAIAHFVIDDAKCSGKLSFNQDQMLHVACKIVWCVLILILM